MAAKTICGSRVIAKMAGIESAAKADVGSSQHEHHHQERRGMHAAGVPEQEPAAVERRHHRDDAPQGPYEPRPLRIGLLRRRPRQPDARCDEERREQVDRPLGRVECRRARDDEDAPKRERSGDRPAHDPSSQRLRHGECGQGEGEDEHVVERQAALDDVSHQVLTARPGPLGNAEDDREAEPRGRPDGGDGCGAADRARSKHHEVDDEQGDGAGDERKGLPRLQQRISFGLVSEGLTRPEGRRHRAKKAVLTAPPLAGLLPFCRDCSPIDRVAGAGSNPLPMTGDRRNHVR